jgi:hypothetical protein
MSERYLLRISRRLSLTRPYLGTDLLDPLVSLGGRLVRREGLT